MSIAELPYTRACAAPTGHCLADDSTRLGNREFARRVEVAAAVLRDRGVVPGAIVAVCLPNCVDLVVTIFAAWRLGAAVTPVNPALTAEEARYQVEDAGAVIVIAADDRPGSVEVGQLSVDTADHAVPEPVPSADDDLALVIYTSGTTGRPKGVMLDHGNVNAMVRMIVDGLELTAEDHSLLILPLFHVNGVVVSILAPLLAGGQATITRRFSASSFFDLVERVQPTYFSAVPAIYAMLVAQPDGQAEMSSLRLAVCGAAPMPAELIGRFESRFGVPIVEGYGLSEGTCASTLNPLAGPRKPGTVGRPLRGQTVAVLGPDGQVRDDGKPGEVVVRGPNVMRGYLGQPAATAETIVDGWLRTGDVGFFDADGYLILVDRIKDLIIRGGENIYPKEIENTLHAHPGVLEAAVVGMADPVLGEVPVAHVVAAPGAVVGDAELIEHCRQRLTKAKVPVTIRLTDALPRNPVGKVDKKALRRLIAIA
ncbi:AMP-dependent synthetase [Mycolicibacterium sp. CH28]|uniref:class I adenylate-forming enzyme family protein n=1 Tax=Mycolicibacterium sp. CH28 TaxID=2512237 RepID=UPI0010812114|nr:AMP-binding protein [Mycolicibacterium sp. CH28]TGD90521.1 AMP-dependent synthetase [Mycolicibacterium sp. CH28]